ncbi:MAG: nucleotidyl transferase AbiEii/AbiGii toxin family protein [Coriobacteriales bacterium]|jgi:hypothetical protein|nr:nucleotidyl transferase AbiEii/AbiGii toxin family protein [Coriobacteriales bacterium]
MQYQTPAALESAIRDVARHSEMDTGRAITLLWWDRFLSRVFTSECPEFVLKGGLSMLARVCSRYTKDIDLAAEEADINAAEKKLVTLASFDLGDFFQFSLKDSESIKPDAEYRTGRRLIFDVVIGSQRRGTIKVDLVVGCMPIGELERVAPANRLNVKGLPAADYYLYPIADTVADKVCATIATYPEDRQSSRVKDLIDLVVIANKISLAADILCKAIASEMRQRKLRGIVAFCIPDSWRTNTISASYRKLAQEANLSAFYYDIESAEELVKRLVDPLIGNDEVAGRWDPDLLAWVT